MIPITSPPLMIKNYALKFTEFFSRPQFSHFVTYLTGLIVSVNKTVQGMNDNFIGRKDQSSLNNFITDSDWDENAVDDRRIELINEHTKDIKAKDSYLIIDDTLSHKTGKKMEQVDLFYDHTIHKSILGHQLVTSLLVSGNKHFPIKFRIYKKFRHGDPTFKTKIELAQELIREAVQKAINFSCVIFDSWYLSQAIVKLLSQFNKYWICPLKTNRIVLEHNKRIPLKEYVSKIPKHLFTKKNIKGSYYYYYAQTVKISKLGKIKLVLYHETEDFSDPLTIIGSNAHVWTPDKIIYCYKQRWSIETFYKDSKQNLGLEDYELRKIKGIIRHWYLVFSAYTLLQLSSSEKSLTKWINSNLKTIGDQCRFAVNETIKYFALWVMKMYHSIHDEEKVVTLIFNTKAKLRLSLE